jgi:methylated-DNA-protein-cysteine methyltransferase-like protein
LLIIEFNYYFYDASDLRMVFFQLKNFYSQVYEVVAKIPKGKITTYGQIAVNLGRGPGGARLVGWAMKAAPENLHLPCHRIVNRLGQLSPEYAFGSKDVQKQMLLSEGITFNEDGLINVKKHFWSGD